MARVLLRTVHMRGRGIVDALFDRLRMCTLRQTEAGGCSSMHGTRRPAKARTCARTGCHQLPNQVWGASRA